MYQMGIVTAIGSFEFRNTGYQTWAEFCVIADRSIYDSETTPPPRVFNP